MSDASQPTPDQPEENPALAAEEHELPVVKARRILDWAQKRVHKGVVSADQDDGHDWSLNVPHPTVSDAVTGLWVSDWAEENDAQYTASVMNDAPAVCEAYLSMNFRLAALHAGLNKIWPDLPKLIADRMKIYGRIVQDSNNDAYQALDAFEKFLTTKD